MTPSPNPRRWRWLLSMLLAAGALAIFGDKTPVSTATPVAARAVVKASTVGATTDHSRPSAAPLETLEMPIDRGALYPLERSTTPPRDLFAVTTWTPPPPAAIALPVVEAPALPSFNVIGKKYEAQQWEVYLVRDDQTLIARAGETLDGDMRVDQIAPPTMTMTMLSTGQTMTFNIGEAR